MRGDDVRPGEQCSTGDVTCALAAPRLTRRLVIDHMRACGTRCRSGARA